MIIGFIVCSIIAALFVVIGISGFRSKKPVGFFTFAKTPEVSDVGKYNRSVSILWIIAAVLLEILGVPFLFLEQNSPMFVLVILGAAALVIGMMIGYIKIEKKYRA